MLYCIGTTRDGMRTTVLAFSSARKRGRFGDTYPGYLTACQNFKTESELRSWLHDNLPDGLGWRFSKPPRRSHAWIEMGVRLIATMHFLPSVVAPYIAAQLQEFEKRLNERGADSPSADEARALLAAVELQILKERHWSRDAGLSPMTAPTPNGDLMQPQDAAALTPAERDTGKK